MDGSPRVPTRRWIFLEPTSTDHFGYGSAMPRRDIQHIEVTHKYQRSGCGLILFALLAVAAFRLLITMLGDKAQEPPTTPTTVPLVVPRLLVH